MFLRLEVQSSGGRRGTRLRELSVLQRVKWPSVATSKFHEVLYARYGTP